MLAESAHLYATSAEFCFSTGSSVSQVPGDVPLKPAGSADGLSDNAPVVPAKAVEPSKTTAASRAMIHVLFLLIFCLLPLPRASRLGICDWTSRARFLPDH